MAADGILWVDAVAEIWRNPPVIKHQIQPEYTVENKSGLTRDGTAETISRDQILRRKWGQEKYISPCSVDRELQEDWQRYIQYYPVDPYSSG